MPEKRNGSSITLEPLQEPPMSSVRQYTSDAIQYRRSDGTLGGMAERVVLPSFVMSFRHVMVAPSVSKSSAWKFRRPLKNSETTSTCTAISKTIAHCALKALTLGKLFLRGTRIAKRRKITSSAISRPLYSVQRMIAHFKRQRIQTLRSTNDRTQVNQRSRKSSAIMKIVTKHSIANAISNGTKRLTLDSAKNGYASVVRALVANKHLTSTKEPIVGFALQVLFMGIPIAVNGMANTIHWQSTAAQLIHGPHRLLDLRHPLACSVLACQV